MRASRDEEYHQIYEGEKGCRYECVHHGLLTRVSGSSGVCSDSNDRLPRADCGWFSSRASPCLSSSAKLVLIQLMTFPMLMSTVRQVRKQAAYRQTPPRGGEKMRHRSCLILICTETSYCQDLTASCLREDAPSRSRLVPLPFETDRPMVYGVPN